MDLVALAVPFFLLAIGLEIVWGLWRGCNTYRLNDSFSSLMLGILSQAQKFVALGLGGVVYDHIVGLTGGALWDEAYWLTWIVAFVLYDLCYYWLHRLGHERQLLWAAHVAHHQSEEYNLSTALRQTSTGFLLGWVFYIPMYAIGIPATVVVTVGALNLIYQFWVHTRHVPELGWFEYVFVSPSNHRVHHAQNDIYLDRNYGGVFIIWDRLFGTYQRELPSEPCVYGIRGPIRSWNPLVALTHIYCDMLSDMRHAASWADKLRVLWARTGWQPKDVQAQWPRQKSDLNAFQPFDPPTSTLTRWFGALQIVGATGLLAWGQFTPLSQLGYWAWWLLLVLTGVSTAWWLENRPAPRCLAVEIPRLVLLGAGIGFVATAGWSIAGAVWWLASAIMVAIMTVAPGAPKNELKAVEPV